ncbi:MAG: hypothetical protein L6Q95_11245, partial [Planctomycetes bacterium]|nr:hypothetical protein [Planctomycetota bacterium]
MFDRFTDRARKVLGLSRQEAQRFNHDYIGVEHVLLGLVAEGGGTAAGVLKSLDIDPKRIRREVERHMSHGTTMVTMGQLPFTPRARRMLELALEEASGLGHDYIGTEHLLLGLIREGDGIAAQALHRLGLSLEEARHGVQELLGATTWMVDGLSDVPSGFDRFTDSARKAMGRCWQEARRLGHHFIGTEHLLLGLLDDDDVAGCVLRAMRVDLARAREEVKRRMRDGGEPIPERQLPFTPGVKVVVGLAFDEARSGPIGTEHLLLGLIREEEGIAAQVLAVLGVRLERVRKELLDIFGPKGEAPGPGDALLTGRARKAMALAREEAERLRHDGIGPEHILLGIVGEEAEIGGELSKLLLRAVRTEVGKLVTPGTRPGRGHPPLTPLAMTVLEHARTEAHALGHVRIGTGHLIVGLIRGDGPAARALAAAGIRLEDALEDVRKRGADPFVAKMVAAFRGALRSLREAADPSKLNAMALAREAAGRFRHASIGTEHVLLGLVAAGAGALGLLRRLGVDPERVRTETERRMIQGSAAVAPGQLPFTPGVKRALELALEEANALGHGAVREEHLLLGLAREGGAAAQVLAELGVAADALRREIAAGPP